MKLESLEGPDATALVELATVKDELGITDGGEDDLLNALIDRASRVINDVLGRGEDGLARQRWRETLGAKGGNVLRLSRYPVESVVDAKEDGQSVSDVEVYDPEAGMLWRDAGWSHTGPRRGLLRSGMTREHHEVAPDYVVEYWAGYRMPSENVGPGEFALPGVVEDAALVTVKAWYNARTRDPSLQSKRIGDVSKTYRGGGEEGGGRLPSEAFAQLSGMIPA